MQVNLRCAARDLPPASLMIFRSPKVIILRSRHLMMLARAAHHHHHYSILLFTFHFLLPPPLIRLFARFEFVALRVGCALGPERQGASAQVVIFRPEVEKTRSSI